MNTSEIITIDSEVLGGAPVFKGTRVPIKTLFEYLENGYALDEFLECFPSVSRDWHAKSSNALNKHYCHLPRHEDLAG